MKEIYKRSSPNKNIHHYYLNLMLKFYGPPETVIFSFPISNSQFEGYGKNVILPARD